MWQRFTERARKVVFYAQEETQRLHQSYVSTEHIALGLCRETDNLAARALEKVGVSMVQLRNEVEAISEVGTVQDPRSGDMTLTPRAKRVIDLAYDEARLLNNNYIGTEHLLLGLVREGDGLAGRALAKLGVELTVLRCRVMELQALGIEGASLPDVTIAANGEWRVDETVRDSQTDVFWKIYQRQKDPDGVEHWHYVRGLAIERGPVDSALRSLMSPPPNTATITT